MIEKVTFTQVLNPNMMNRLEYSFIVLQRTSKLGLANSTSMAT